MQSMASLRGNDRAAQRSEQNQSSGTPRSKKIEEVETQRTRQHVFVGRDKYRAAP